MSTVDIIVLQVFFAQLASNFVAGEGPLRVLKNACCLLVSLSQLADSCSPMVSD